jgi:hypothetical protein
MITEAWATAIGGVSLLAVMVGGHVTTQVDIAINTTEIENIDTRLERMEDKIDLLISRSH